MTQGASEAGSTPTLGARLERAIEEHLSAPERAPLCVTASPDEIAARVRECFRFDRATPLDQVFESARELLYEAGEHASHPGYFGLFRPGTDRGSVYAEALAALFDPNLAVRRFAPAAAEIERHTLRTIARHFGAAFSDGIAHFTSGGQEANHTAAIVAASERLAGFAEEGVCGNGGRPRIYLSEEAHHSFEKIAHACGLGRRALRWIPCDRELRLEIGALREAILRDLDAGDRPFLVVATAGTTSAGAIDPMAEMASIAQEHALWFHVDAAWAGAAALSPRLAQHLAGIELADSITCDAHKWLSVPVGAGMFFCRHARAVQSAFAVETAYAPPTRGDWTGYSSSLQWSRRLMGLKLCFLLAELGLAGVAERLERMTELGEFLRRSLVDGGWRILNTSPFPLVCFTHGRLRGDRKLHARLARAVQEDGRAWISATTLPGSTPALRACITNFRSCESDVRSLIDALGRALG